MSQEPRRAYLKVSEAAEFLGISRTLCYELVRARKLPSVRLGTAIRIPADRLRDYLAAVTVEPDDGRRR